MSGDYDGIVATLLEQNKEQDRRISELEKTYKALTELTYITQDLVKSVQTIADNQQKHNDRIVKLEHAPGDGLVKIRDCFILAIVSGLAGWLVSILVH